MNVFTSLIILILVVLLQTSFQLSPGILSLFSHYTIGRFSKKKSLIFNKYFILGAISFFLLFFLIINLCLSINQCLFLKLNIEILKYILCGMLIALCLFSFFFYYQKGNHTKLFISRKIANCFVHKAKTAKKPSDAFLLGFLSALPELFLTLPLFIITSIEISNLTDNPFYRFILIILYVIIAIIPLLIIDILYRNNYNLADIEKKRIKNKSFFCFFMSFLYLLIALFIIIFRILM